MYAVTKGLFILMASCLLVACGGGGDSSSNNNLVNTPTPSNNSSNTNTSNNNTNVQCMIGQIKLNGLCQSAANVCNVEAEKVWVRGHLDDLYLWNNEIKEVSSDKYPSLTPQEYFDALLVKEKDRFSFTMSKREAEGFFESGLQVSYGVKWAFDYQNALRVRFVEPTSEAAKDGIVRGDYVVSINGQAIANMTDDAINKALDPANSSSVIVQLKDVSQSKQKTINLLAKEFITSPVPTYNLLTDPLTQERIGYVLFNEHIATASKDLIVVMNYFQQQQIHDLVLDLRFNGGGLIDVANELAAMIGGTKVKNQLFSRTVYNENFFSDSEKFYSNAVLTGVPLPQLNLSRVFVLTSKETCSASEEIINSLLPFMQVIRIGDDTCGKPYGMIKQNNCDTAYFAISSKSENANFQSVPTIGFAPTCRAYENFDDAFGSPFESLFYNALFYRGFGQCASSEKIQSSKLTNQPRIRPLAKPQWQRNMIILGDKK